MIWVLALAGCLAAGCRNHDGGHRPVPEPTTPTDTDTDTVPPTDTTTEPAPTGIVFVSRAIDGGDLPGVGPHSRVRPASPGRLLAMYDGQAGVAVLVDGAEPAPPFALVDVNAPTVSWDGRTIVFAGLSSGSWPTDPGQSVGGWRLYAIDADGRNLRAVTRDDPEPDLSQFGAAEPGLAGYDDYDPAFLPDGRLVFSSTRWPAYAQFGGVRTSQLYVVDIDGSRLRRITAERNGADRPLVDPITGKIVYARWWRNQRMPIDDRSTVFANGVDDADGYVQKDGLTIDVAKAVGGEQMVRNAWHAATIRPDGTELAMWTGRMRDEVGNGYYGGGFAPDGTLYGNWFPVADLVDAAGFGGIRRLAHGAVAPVGILGSAGPESPPVDPTGFAAEPEVLPDGDLVVSWAEDLQQDYGLYTVHPDGTGLTLLYDEPDRSELRARVLGPRPVPPVLEDQIDPDTGPLPPTAEGPYDIDGTFTFGALNVFFNAPVDVDIVSAPAIGTVSTIRFFLDQQRTADGTVPEQDWPIPLGEVAIDYQGSVTDGYAPAGVPLFEQLRGPDDTVPLTGGPHPEGTGHVTGLNFGFPGAFALCVGCHAGHSLIPTPFDHAESRWTNLAPGASVATSSSRDRATDGGLVDRRAWKGDVHDYWTTAPGRGPGAWAELQFLVPIAIRDVRLWDPRPDSACSVHVRDATVELLRDGVVVATAPSGALSPRGTDVAFAEVVADAVRVTLDDVTGLFDGSPAGGLAEIEVVGRGHEEP